MKKMLLISIALVTLASSCSEFTRLQKENNVKTKLDGAKNYYDEGEYLKAGILYEELIPVIRGTALYEEVLYLHAMSTYKDEDYILGHYYLSNFVKTFPTSEYSEECAFLAAKSLYNESPSYSLDQAETVKAIDALQLFLDKYPQTGKKDEINEMVKTLRAKLEVKAFHTAKQYHRTKRYKSAVIALNNAIKSYPDSQYREEMMLLILESSYELAINSVATKKEERLKDTIDAYHNFADAYAESNSLKKASSWYDNAVKELERLQQTP